MQRLHLQPKIFLAIICRWVELSTTGEYKLTVGLQMLKKTEKRIINKGIRKGVRWDLNIFLVEYMEGMKPKGTPADGSVHRIKKSKERATYTSFESTRSSSSSGSTI
jgi:hypothetical protein